MKETVSLIGALGNWAIAILAVWGGWVRARLLGPKLHLQLDPQFPKGELTESRMPDGKQKREERYYHLRLSNQRIGRFPVAREARVMITQVETPGPDGKPQVSYTGMLPLMWSYQQVWSVRVGCCSPRKQRESMRAALFSLGEG